MNSNVHEENSRIKWYKVEGGLYTEILGQTNKMYNATAADVGSYISFGITPVDSYKIAGEEIKSISVLILSQQKTVNSGEGKGSGVSSTIIVSGPTPTPTPTPIPLPPKPNTFNDVKGHWAENEVNLMASKGILAGDTAGNFRPDDNITRAEFIAIIVRALSLTETTYNNAFADVSNSDWFANDVQSAYNAGLVSGSDGLINPNNLITREEMTKIIIEGYKKSATISLNGSIEKFIDKNQISDWAKDYVASAIELKFINGIGDDTFAPKQNATRAQAATIIKRLIDVHQD